MGDMETFNQALVVSTLSLVDLAGSERVKKSRASGDRLVETKYINSSLSTLGSYSLSPCDCVGKCIHELTNQNSSYIPFRDSKLTRLLQDSLGGNSKTSMIITIGPSEDDIE